MSKKKVKKTSIKSKERVEPKVEDVPVYPESSAVDLQEEIKELKDGLILKPNKEDILGKKIDVLEQANKILANQIQQLEALNKAVTDVDEVVEKGRNHLHKVKPNKPINNDFSTSTPLNYKKNRGKSTYTDGMYKLDPNQPIVN